MIWIHWPTGVLGLPSAQAVARLPSKALTGSYCGCVGEPGAVRRRGDAGGAGQHGDGLMAGGRHRKDLARRAARPAERVVGRVGLGGGVGEGRVRVGQPELVVRRGAARR